MARNFKALSASGSPFGELISVIGVDQASATTLHVAQSTFGDDNFDEIWLYAVNTHTLDVELSVLWDGKLIPINIPARQGFSLIIPGMRINNAKEIKAFAGTTNVINVKCDVNRIVVEADA